MIASVSNAGERARRVTIEEVFDLVLKWCDKTHAFFVQLGTNASFLIEIEIPDQQAMDKVGRLRTVATARSRHRVFKPYLCQSLQRAPAFDNEHWAWEYRQTSVLLYSAVGEEGVIPLLWQVAAPDNVKAAMSDDDASLFHNDFL